ncbi:hypothetical protein [Bosea thiooxidans]
MAASISLCGWRMDIAGRTKKALEFGTSDASFFRKGSHGRADRS